MLEALALTIALNTSSTEKPEARNVSFSQPEKGNYAAVVVQAATVPKEHKPFAKCVLRHETGAVLHNKDSREDAKNPISSASGRWQFLDNSWRHGGSHMVRERLIEHGMPKKQAKAVRQHLGSKPIRTWDGYFQDVLFNEVIERGGFHHWTGTGCGYGT